MTLISKSVWDGLSWLIVVEDTSGGVWHPDEETQAIIQASTDPPATSIRLCDQEPMRGEWVG